MNTPALSTYLCKACNYSTNEDLEMFNHLMCGDHSKTVTKCNSKSKLLTCSLCSFSTNRKDDLIKHMRTKTHIKTLTKYKNSDVTKSAEKSSAEVNPPKIQSRFGRNLKKTKARESCIYDTPEEVGLDPVPTKRSKQANNSKNVKSTKSKAQEVVSPRRKVMNPFKNVENVETVNIIKPVKSMEDILEKISANPKTVKQRQQNAEALKEYNENHEDDIFGGSSKPASKSTLIKSSTTLLSQDSDSDSEQDISVHSARTPMTSYFGSRRGLALTTPMLNQDRTPGILTQDSPIVPVPVNGERFQNQAYIHRKVAEKMKVSRNLKRHKLASALKVVSRTEADKMVDESSQVINTITNHTASLAEVAEEVEESEEWFDDDQENLSCDPGRGLMELLAKKP